MREYDELGRDAFLAKYGFKRSTKFVVIDSGREYDSKALLAAAHGFQYSEKGPLPNTFSGGEPTTATSRRVVYEKATSRSVSI
jgi:putative restriction endonuclease